MARLFPLIAVIPALSGCAGVALSKVDDGRSLEYRSVLPAVTLSLDAACKATSQVVSLPGPPRYISFRSGLGKADTGIEFGPGGVITKFNSKTEGQTDDALKILSAVMGAAGMTGLEASAVGGDDGPKCKPTVATYLISYDAAGRPSIDLNAPLFLKVFQ